MCSAAAEVLRSLVLLRCLGNFSLGGMGVAQLNDLCFENRNAFLRCKGKSPRILGGLHKRRQFSLRCSIMAGDPCGHRASTHTSRHRPASLPALASREDVRPVRLVIDHRRSVCSPEPLAILGVSIRNVVVKHQTSSVLA